MSCVLETSVELTNLSQIFTNVQMNRFHYNLPQKIRRLKRNNDIKNTNDRKMKRVKQENLVNTNPNPVREWKLRANEQWATMFCNKTREGPMLSMGCQPCLKYHCKGTCFNDCRFQAAHVAFSGNDKALTTQLIKELQGE